VAISQSDDIRALLGGGADEDRVATAHFLIGAMFLVVGGLLELLALFSVRFADIFPISFGRLEAMANLTLLVGFAILSLLGGIYYVLPRLTGVRLQMLGLARLALLGISGLVVAGWLVIGFGLGTGREPFGLPWWVDAALTAVVVLPAGVVVQTIRRREEKRSFATLWFAIGASVWLPLLFVTNLASQVLPGLGSVSDTYGDLFFSAGLITMFVLTAGTGLTYYTVVKELDVALASRQLALVGFWSLGFAGVWWGVAQLVFGPGPAWVSGVAAALGLAFPIGALANAANVSLTLEGSWNEVGERPGVASGVLGLYFTVVIALMASLGSFPSLGSVTALTGYWEAIEYAAVLGAGALLVAGIAFEALPRIAGRRLPNSDRARSFNRLTVIGAGGVLVTLAAAGIIDGYSWLAGSNSAAYIDAGDGWGAGSGASQALTLLAIGFAVVAFLGQISYASVIAGTLFSGKAVPQELLVDTDDE
jgi:cytochrome c oxidase cbb3-type subunit 1